MGLKLHPRFRKRIAKHNIIVYKHLRYIDGLVTTYKRFPVEIGSTYESPMNIITCNNVKRQTTCKYVLQGLHSFKTLKACKADMRKFQSGTYSLCRCCIPKGSSYYVGGFAGSRCIVSDRLVYLELL